MKDLIIVFHDGVTLILPADRVQGIKMIVKELDRQLEERL